MSVNTESPASSSPSSPLRHLTSSSNLSPGSRLPASRRNSQHISRSPTSIPSSPTSVHSGSSAIFERDIEPINSASSLHHHHHPADPHRIARGHNSETLEHSVPSVLDSAAEILTATSISPASLAYDEEEITVIAPNPVYTSASTSPLSTSRSPSPGGAFKPSRTSMLLNLPNILPGHSPNLAAVSLPPIVAPFTAFAVSNTDVVTPAVTDKQPISISTPTSAYYSLASSASSSPTTTTMESHPLRLNALPNSLPTTPPVLPTSSTGSPRPRIPTPSSASPNSNTIIKRLSFLSYTDLITSTPSSTLPLSSLTTALSTNQSEPHSRSLFLEPDLDVDSDKFFESPQNSVRGRRSVASNTGATGSLSLVDAEGGEWQREGFGRGLEERLEMVADIPVVAGALGM